ncbi:enoyl-CoA hydratase/isomerase family protein [Mucilaginibacter psychrotolerans]|uniref:Enoyl-CoA hydratase/isomerase family protein n=1 Tax=Mucilaginibacter psychrotolerans TaxID=1524096 RepID=A0A4Y8SH46_9SPHI|nr:enoyl-CoA hydratase/isomerase family protein [Mucilaginibacter psychrotolerans]TFF37774.1 enoyl-CoA hydratase/isomerase family protein [Mucilaginibacter psychrotolerans]
MNPYKLLRSERINVQVAKVTFANPPVNLISPETVSELFDLITELSKDELLKAVIFASRTEDYFYNHFDLSKFGDFPKPQNDGDVPLWTDIIFRLSQAPFISIALIRGRTRGGGNELALAMDLRYASKEKAFFGQPEVGTGILPGGGGSEWLPRVIGRDRALEVILTGMDYDAETAEKYGWITRSVSDDELDSFVDNITERLVSFDKQALISAKSQINRASLPPREDFLNSYKEFSESMKWPSLITNLQNMAELASHVGPAELEKNLGYYLGVRKKDV